MYGSKRGSTQVSTMISLEKKFSLCQEITFINLNKSNETMWVKHAGEWILE